MAHGRDTDHIDHSIMITRQYREAWATRLCSSWWPTTSYPPTATRYAAVLGRAATADGSQLVVRWRVGSVQLVPASAPVEVLPGETAPWCSGRRRFAGP